MFFIFAGKETKQKKYWIFTTGQGTRWQEKLVQNGLKTVQYSIKLTNLHKSASMKLFDIKCIKRYQKQRTADVSVADSQHLPLYQCSHSNFHR
jgi:hypothetical protein